MENISIQYFKNNYGELIIGSFRDQLCLCDWRYRKMRANIDKRIQRECLATYVEESCELISETIEQLNEYFAGERKEFSIPLLLIGTDFQKQVWNTLRTVSYGETDSYIGLSERMNNPKAIRAVATANGANAISIIIPCHRIIGKDGDLVGYAGGLDAKRKLLELEKKNKDKISYFCSTYSVNQIW